MSMVERDGGFRTAWYAPGFCCEAHRLQATSSSILRFSSSMWLGSSGAPHTRSTTWVFSERSAQPLFMLYVLVEAHPEYKPLQEQFISSWKHRKTAHRISVARIIRIQVQADVRKRHEEYKRIAPNTRRCFHGTSCSAECGSDMPCFATTSVLGSCCMCSICIDGFKIHGYVGRSKSRGSRQEWLQYGKGVYFSGSSGKANDFAASTKKRAGNNKMVRRMLVADVVVGTAFRTFRSRLPEEWCPPLGYNSVVAEVGPCVNYDQLVVYNEAAALPTHIIEYCC
eukprot:jgi/Undpi1/13884/HiC_scaffold_9.g03535.m1